MDHNFAMENFDRAVGSTSWANTLQEQLGALEQRSQIPSTSEKSLITAPEEFTGDRTRFYAWRSQLQLFVSMNTHWFPNEQVKVLYAISTV